MTAGYRLSVEGKQDVERRLALLEARVGDIGPLMDQIASAGIADTQDNFAGEHSPAGVPWKPAQRVLQHGGKTLQYPTSRRLYLSLAGRSGSNWAEWGSNMVYAGRHNYGFSGAEQVASHKRIMRQVFGVELREPIEVTVQGFTRQANTPQRQFLGLSLALVDEIEGLAADYVGAEQ